MPEGKVTVGAVAVNIVPSADGFLSALSAQILPQTAAVADKIGEQFSEKIKTKTKAGVKDGLKGSDADATDAGEKAGKNFAGAFGRQAKAALKAVEAALPEINIKGNTKQFDKQLDKIREKTATLTDLTIDADLSSEKFLSKVQKLRVKIAELQAESQITIDAKVNLAESTAALAALEEKVLSVNTTTGQFAQTLNTTLRNALTNLPTPKIDMQVTGTKKAQDELEVIRGDLTRLRSKRIGIDIDAAEAVASVAAVGAALEALAAKTTDARLRLDIEAALKNLAAFSAAATITKAQVEKPIELKLRQGAFVDDLRAALGAGAGKILEIPVDADVSPAEKELARIGKQMDRLAARKLTPKFNDEDLLAAAERIQARLEKLTDTKFGEAINYQARSALKGLKGFTDGVAGENFTPKVDFKETEINAGAAAKKVQQAFSSVLADLPDPIITARDNAPEVQQRYEKVFNTLKDASVADVLDLPTPDKVKVLEDASKDLQEIKRLGRVSVDLDLAIPKSGETVGGLITDLEKFRGDAKPATRELGSLKSEILSVAQAMQKALGDGFDVDLLGNLPADLKRETAQMVEDVTNLNATKIGDLGTDQLLTRVRATSEAFKDLASLPGLSPELITNFKAAGAASDDLLKKVNELHGKDITPELRAQELQKNAGALVQSLAAQFGKLENALPKFRIAADKNAATEQIDKIRAAAGDLKLQVGVDLSPAQVIARAVALHRELQQIIKKPLTADVKLEAESGLRETTALLKSVGAESQVAKKSIFGLFEGFSDMTPAAKLANLAAVAFIGAIVLGVPLAATAIIGLTGLVITLGAAFGAAALGVGVLALAFSKVSAAIKAKEAGQKAAAANAASDAQTELSNAIAVKNANDAIAASQETLSTARTTASRNARDNALAVTAAEKNLTQAQTKETAARKKLNDAYKSAKVDLAKLTAEIKANQVAQYAAVVSITQAKEKLNALYADPTASESDIEAAKAAYNTQETSLKSLQATQAENALKKAKYDQDGLAGNDDVISAQAALKDAVDSVADAQLSVTAASTKAREAQIDDAKAINDAETALSKARTDRANLLKQQALAAATTTASRNETTKDYDTASPAVKQFADYYEKNIKPAFAQFAASAASSGILLSIEGFFTKLQPLLPQLNALISTVGTSVAGLIGDLGDVAASPAGKGFIAFLTKEVPKAFDLFGSAAKIAGPFAIHLIEALAPVADKLGPILVDMLGKIADKFSAFADKKNGGLNDLIDQMVKYAPQVISFLGDLFSALGTVAEGLAPLGALAAGALNQLFKLIDTIGPGGIQVILTVLLALWARAQAKKLFSFGSEVVGDAKAVGGGLKSLRDKFLALEGPAGKLRSFFGSDKGSINFGAFATKAKAAGSAIAEVTGKMIASTVQVVKNTAAWVANAARLVAQKVAMIAVRVATAAWAAVQWVLNAAMSANPIALVVIAIVALIGFVVYAYFHFDKFRHYVDLLWDVFKQFLAWWIKYSPIGLIIQGVMALIHHWDDITRATRVAFEAIRAAIARAIEWIVDHWHAFTDGVASRWHGMLDGIRDGATAAWRFITDHVSSFLGGIENAFHNGVSAIGRAWGVLRNFLAVPIHGYFAIINDGLIGNINTLLSHFPGSLHIDDIPEPAFIKEAAATAHFAKGGVIPGYEPGRDTVPAVLSKGEAVLVPQVARQIGPAQIEEWNRRGLAGMPIQFFATGTGSVDLVPRITAFERQSGVPFTVTSGYRAGDPGYHGKHMAVDAADSTQNMASLAKWLYGRAPYLLELIHSGGPGYFVKDGSTTSADTYRSVVAEHYNHVHTAMSEAGLLAAKVGAVDADADNSSDGGIVGTLLSTFKNALAAPAQKLLAEYGDTPLVKALAGTPEMFASKITKYVTDKVKALGDKILGFGKSVLNAGKSVLDRLGITSSDEDEDTSVLGTQARKLGVQASGSVAAAYAKTQLKSHGWGAEQMAALAELWDGESTWRWNATGDPVHVRGLSGLYSAYGIPQSLPGSKMATAGSDWKTNAFTQVDWGLDYIKSVYGDPTRAYGKWLSREPHWYDQGGYLPPGLTLTMNGTGKPERILTDEQWKAMREQRSSSVGVVVRVEDGAVPGLISAEVDHQFGRLADASIYGGA
jgi:hypothetical protein